MTASRLLLCVIALLTVASCSSTTQLTGYPQPPSDLLLPPGGLIPITDPESAADVIDKNGREVLAWRDRLVRLQRWVSSQDRQAKLRARSE